MCEGTREDGTLIEANDPFWDMLNERARAARGEPLHWLEMRQIYGNLAEKPRFANAFTEWLAAMYRDGMEFTLQRYLKGN